MKFYFYLLFNFCTCSAFAQHQLTGIIKDRADGSPLPFATAALLRPDSSVITGVMTSLEGKFVIENIAAGDYLLRISFISYQTAFHSVNVPAQSDMGEISLSEDTKILGEVLVTSRRPLVVQQLDRTVVNVAGNMITAGRNINDLLKQMPGLVVDQDGNAKLNGRPATVYIDGRPTRLPAEQVTQMLNGMMGDVVDRVELIDNPSSRYEAGMSAAIVNIRLKRDASLGVNGTIQAGNGFTDNDFVLQDGLNLNYRSKKMNFFGNYGFRHRPGYMEQEYVKNYDYVIPISYHQSMLNRSKGPGHTFRAGIDGFINTKQTIGFLFNGSFNDIKGFVDSKFEIKRTDFAEIDSTILTDSKLTNKYKSQMYNLNYRFEISKGEELTADADYGRVNARNWQNMRSRYFDDGSNEKQTPAQFQYTGSRNIDIYSFKSDYIKPFSDKSRLEAGIKTGQTLTDNDIFYENMYNGEWVDDITQSNRFKYAETVSAAYATYSRQFGKFSAMAGMRAEHTYVNGESPTIKNTFSRSYIGWFPSAYLQYQITNRQALNFSYSRKLNRPSYNLLNPFRTYVDRFTSFGGNPDLQPEYSNTVAIRYNTGGYNINASYSVVNDVFERLFVQNDTEKTTHISYDNIGKREQLVLSAYTPIRIAKWYNLNISAQASYYKFDALYNNAPLKSDFLMFNSYMQHSFTILPTLRTNFFVWWQSPGRNGIIARFESLWTMNGQIEKTFFDKRLSVSLSFDDLFDTQKISNGKIIFGNINQTFKEHFYQRQMILTLRYNFGSQQIRGIRNRSVGIEEEIGRTR